jgi:hypothetical protein
LQRLLLDILPFIRIATEKRRAASPASGKGRLGG